ncbi:hypothetical protein JN09_001420 [Acholeplasma morum]|jgi:hypothetical protein|uniref:hypothetical protein n=1 Tax=Paracholeplasma morum TaxID=264637 RepID=UPI00195C1C8C|nr:hypothetical protein [Paracholeplasma morum]MBM7454076.1 hypothetical protein [Paracholeplasma morum]
MQSVILFICNHGYAYEAMAEARKAGARGGTIIHGRSSISTEKQKFFGITIHPEKDILMIVCLDEQRQTLMKAITSKYGVSTDARGLCFAMQVEDSIGFSFEPLPLDK